ncbi:hypothetical protein LCGC14_2205340 [marine sediment metagenome]|uniref:Uncharacterized protein n=1 Tax=marine sediment metagenome TaxID=412755 RepID=A0A0F9DFD6_9ZZZZ
MLKLTDDYSQQGEEQVRIIVEPGGPKRLEFTIKADQKSTRLSVWNPFRREWATVELIGQGDSCRATEKLGHGTRDAEIG